LKGSYFPLWTHKKDFIYQGYPYFYKEIDYYGKKKLIIPIQVILSYFYYLSPRCIHDILHNDFRKGVIGLKSDGSNYKLEYKSSIIRDREVRLLGKYYFTNSKFALKEIFQLPNNILTKILNDPKGYYLSAKIPFEFDCSFHFYGQYIDEENKNKEQKFLVHGISKVTPFGNESFFSKFKFDIEDLEDKSSTENRDNKEERLYNAIVPNYLHNTLQSVEYLKKYVEQIKSINIVLIVSLSMIYMISEMIMSIVIVLRIFKDLMLIQLNS